MRESLDVLVKAAVELGEPGIAQDARAFAERLIEGRIFLACVGQFKRGKSTLLNALLGEAILPTGVVPVTSAITVVAYGAQPSARVQFENGAEDVPLADIDGFVTEDRNPGNRKHVQAVEVSLPASVLRNGLCLVDTPGIGSVFGANTTATRRFVPHIDAALIVVGGDPPLTGEELSLAAEVARETPALFVVLNKADRLSADERRQASDFARTTLKSRLDLDVSRIYEVSAVRALAGESSGDWADLLAGLRQLAAARESLLDGRAGHREEAMRAMLQAAISEREEALRRPLAESEVRMRNLRSAVERAEQALTDLSALFASEQSRVVDALNVRRKAFLAEIGPAAMRALKERTAAALSQPDPHDDPMETARLVAREAVGSWSASVAADASALYKQSMRRFVALADEFLVRLAAEGPDFHDLPRALVTDVGLTAAPRFYFTEMLSAGDDSPVKAMARRALPRAARQRRAALAGTGYLERLLETNASRFVNDLIDRVGESRKQLESDIRELLQRVVRRAEAAFAAARLVRAAGDDRVRGEIERLSRIRVAVSARPSAPAGLTTSDTGAVKVDR